MTPLLAATSAELTLAVASTESVIATPLLVFSAKVVDLPPKLYRVVWLAPPAFRSAADLVPETM
jgi:hypothetical protein